MWKNPEPMERRTRGHVVTHDDERRTAFVDLELAAVWKGPSPSQAAPPARRWGCVCAGDGFTMGTAHWVHKS
jgi:hypothetical protein